MVENKDYIDYRYVSQSKIRYRKVQQPKEIKAFYRSVAKYEKNCFSGVDLMKSKNAYFCLESNPGLGWIPFNHSSKAKFATNVLNKLLKRNS